MAIVSVAHLDDDERALMKQARGFGVGVVIATQSPTGLDYRALSTPASGASGVCTDADRARVVEGMKLANGQDDIDYDAMLQQLPPRWFLIRNAHASGSPQWVQPRWAITLIRGPMARQEIRRARAA